MVFSYADTSLAGSTHGQLVQQYDAHAVLRRWEVFGCFVDVDIM